MVSFGIEMGIGPGCRKPSLMLLMSKIHLLQQKLSPLVHVEFSVRNQVGMVVSSSVNVLEMEQTMFHPLRVETLVVILLLTSWPSFKG